MNDARYDQLNKKYQDLLAENRYLKARVEKLESEPHSLESDPKALQAQELSSKETCEDETGIRTETGLMETGSTYGKAVDTHDSA